MAAAALLNQMPLKCSMICPKEVQARIKCSTICFRDSKPHPPKLRASKALDLVLGNRRDDDDDEGDSAGEDSSEDDGPFLMSSEERMDLRRKIREVLDAQPEVEEETDPEKLTVKAQKLARDYSLVVDEEDPDWPEDAEGRGFKLDQFFDKFYIKNVKKEDADEDDEEEEEKEIVWKDDNYIQAVKDITSGDWEETVFKDFNPLVILVHHRYRRPKENEKARIELEKAVQMFWDTGLPSPRCVAVDAVVEDELASVLKVSKFPEIIFTKAGKILHRDKVVRSGDDWSKMMAFFYYKAVRPACLEKSAGENQEKIPSL